jgi:peptide/nickel transport system permease protein
VIRRALSRIGWALFTIWAVVSLTFLINHALPEDPARAIAGPQARPAEVAKIREQLGLNRPILVQYSIFWSRLAHFAKSGDTPAGAPGEHSSCAAIGPLHFDLGTSYQKNRPVISIIGDRLPRTLYLGLVAMLIQVVIGVGTGIVAALRRNSAWDYGTVGMTLIGISAPTFLIGMVLQYFFAYRLRLLPLDGFGRTTAEHAASVILPALTLGIFGAAYYTRLVRDEMIVLMKQDFIRTARSKGVSAIGVVLRHALRNALMPLVTVIGLDLGSIAGGAIVTEKLFRWPGLGQLSVDSVFDRDGPIIMGTVIVASTAIVLANLLVDLSYSLLDPRARGR